MNRRPVLTNQRGSATVAIAGVACAIVILGVVAIGVGAQVVLQNQVRHAVDHAALAAADVLVGVVPGQPCTMARDVLTSVGATLVLCEELSGSVVVEGRLARGVQLAHATARAGVADSGEK